MMPNTEQRELRAYIHRERYSTEQGTVVKPWYQTKNENSGKQNQVQVNMTVTVIYMLVNKCLKRIVLLKIAILSFTHLHIIPRLCDFSFCTVCKPQKEMFKQDVHATKAYGEHGMSKSKNDKKKKKKTIIKSPYKSVHYIPSHTIVLY